MAPCSERLAQAAPAICASAPGFDRAAFHARFNAEVVRYLNRLSDLLFILARAANGGEEPLWEPGRYRPAES